VELSSVGCGAAPNLNPYVLLYAQLNYSADPLIVQYVSLYQQSMRHYRHGRLFNGYLTYGIVPKEDESTNFKRAASPGSNINWLASNVYKERTFFKPAPKLSKNFAVILLKTDKGEKQKFPDSNVQNDLKYVNNNVLKRLVLLKDEASINYVLNYATDALFVVGHADSFDAHPFFKQLSEKLGKEVVLHDIRAELEKSVNLCDGNVYKLNNPTPGKENNCDGDALPVMMAANATEAPLTDLSDDIQAIDDANDASGAVTDHAFDANGATMPHQRPGKRTRYSDSYEPNAISEKYAAYLPWYAKLMSWLDVERILKRLKFASPNVIDKMKAHRHWFEVVNGVTGKIVKITDYPTTIGIRCKFCYQYRTQHDQCTDDGKHVGHAPEKQCSTLNAFARSTGVGPASDIAYKMGEHEKSPQHKISVTFSEDKVDRQCQFWRTFWIKNLEDSWR
jgi:hypothetical protein